MDDNIGTTKAAVIDYIDLTADLACAYVSNNSVPVSELVTLIETLHGALAGLGPPSGVRAVVTATPHQIRKSITYASLISFEDGKPYKTLGRHLRKLGLDPDTYRAKWGLPRDYPMVAAGYSEMRSALAKNAGLGHRRRTAAEPTSESVAESRTVKPKRAGRPRKASADTSTEE